MARKRSSLGFVFWLGLVLLVLVVFVFSRSTIGRVLESTDFFAAVRPRDSMPVVVMRPPTETSQNSATSQTSADIDSETQPKSQQDQSTLKQPPTANESADVLDTKNEPSLSVAKFSPSKTARLFFVSVSQKGEIKLQGVEREIISDAPPLSSILKELLSGPTTDEQQRDIISLIPNEVQLHQASVRDGVAVVDVSQTFRFNSLGREGLLVRLKQLVYSATELPNVNSVQVLIDGNHVDYLGPEGLYIGRPLTRESFEP